MMYQTISSVSISRRCVNAFSRIEVMHFAHERKYLTISEGNFDSMSPTNKKPRLIIRPTRVNRTENIQIAKLHNGRLVNCREALRWLKNEQVDFDIWVGEMGADGYAQYLNGERKDIRQKPATEKCLLGYLIEPKTEQQAKKDLPKWAKFKT